MSGSTDASKDIINAVVQNRSYSRIDDLLRAALGTKEKDLVYLVRARRM